MATVAQADAVDVATVSNVEAYVIDPGGTTNLYRWDQRAERFVLERVVHPNHTRGADLVRIPLVAPPRHTHATGDEAARRPLRAASLVGGDGVPLVGGEQQELDATVPALLALVLADPPLPPGVRLTLRLLGAVRVTTLPPRPARSGEAPNDTRATNTPMDPVRELANWIAVGVPTADAALGHLYTLDALSDQLRARLDRALAEIVSPGEGQDSQAVSNAVHLTAERVAELYRRARAQVRQQRRVAHDAGDGTPYEHVFGGTTDTMGATIGDRLTASAAPAPAGAGAAGEAREETPAWRELTRISPAELRARGATAFAEPERLVDWIPARFLRYLDEILLPGERVLFFAQASTFRVKGWTGEVNLLTEQTHARRWGGARALRRLRSQQLQAGLLLITDRQVLLLRDLAPPDATMVQWGYVARSWPLGRLVTVRALPPGMELGAEALTSWPEPVRERLAHVARFDEVTVPPAYARLVLALEGADGIEVTGAALPAASADALAHAAHLLANFTPVPGPASAADRRVRRVPHVEPWKPTNAEARALESLGDLVSPALVAALVEATRQALAPMEIVLAQARTPRTHAQGPEEAALLTLTPHRLVVVQAPAKLGRGGEPRQPTVRAIPLDALTSVVLQHSLLGSGLVVRLPQAHAADSRDDPETAVDALSIAFPSPLIVPFRALFTRGRTLIEHPPCPHDERVEQVQQAEQQAAWHGMLHHASPLGWDGAHQPESVAGSSQPATGSQEQEDRKGR